MFVFEFVAFSFVLFLNILIAKSVFCFCASIQNGYKSENSS